MSYRPFSVSAFAIFCLKIFAPTGAAAVEYNCPVSQKWNGGQSYSESDIQKWQFRVVIRDMGQTAELGRCSYSSSELQSTCDYYDVDRIEYDHNVSIKKFYVFRNQFDVQLFRDLSFIENNGRGDISTGRCVLSAP